MSCFRATDSPLVPRPATGTCPDLAAVQPCRPLTCADRPLDEAVVSVAGQTAAGRWLDEETAQWLATLGGTGEVRERAIGRLHEMLLGIARAELHRRKGQHPVTGPELDDLAHQAANDAVPAITTKLAQFRGESRFTTWAYRFVILEVSAKLGRHFWQRPAVAFGAEDWDRLPDRFGVRPRGARPVSRSGRGGAPGGRAGADRPAAAGIRCHRGQRCPTGRARGSAWVKPQRDLQDDVRRAA